MLDKSLLCSTKMPCVTLYRLLQSLGRFWAASRFILPPEWAGMRVWLSGKLWLSHWQSMTASGSDSLLGVDGGHRLQAVWGDSQEIE